VLFCLGCSLEGAQGFVPGRVPDVADIVANTIGVVIGLTSAWLVMVFASRRPAVGANPNRGQRYE
ncbi:MAG: VanZ family protein, partial [Rhodospirillales bacterium]|nr:VanZ family protein [Rhodospirillales bacterium]